MSPVEERIRAGGATLAFDTNAVVARTRTGALSFSGFFWLCDGVNVLRNGPPAFELSVAVPALVRMEGFHDLRTELAGRSISFDAEMVATELRHKKVVPAFDASAALDASKVLHGWFRTDADWQRAKRDRCLEVLNVQGVNVDGYGVASIDWAIAAQAEACGWVLVTDDEGAEFRNVTLKMKKSALRAVVEQMLRERGLELNSRR